VERLAVAAEARGLDSIWLPEHTHMPVNHTPYPRGELPNEYRHTLDPFVALGIAAGVTKKLKLATGICLAIEHQAVTLAKTVATLDHVSGGRVLLGLGAGWNRTEMENHGTVYADRFRKLEEQMRALREIWTRDVASFHGEFEHFDDIWSWPKPVQRPHPPLILGGESDHTLRRIVRVGDGWLPRAWDPPQVLDGMERLKRFAEEADRDPATISVSVFAPPPKDEVINRFKETDAERIVLMVPPLDEAETLKRLDRYAAYV